MKLDYSQKNRNWQIYMEEGGKPSLRLGLPSTLWFRIGIGVVILLVLLVIGILIHSHRSHSTAAVTSALAVQSPAKSASSPQFAPVIIPIKLPIIS